MSAFVNMQFPDGILVGAEFGPEYLTEVARAPSGVTMRNEEYDEPLRKFSVDKSLTDDEDKFKTFLQFWSRARGKSNTWRIRDLSDFHVLDTEGVFTLVGGNNYQLIRRWNYAGADMDTTIILPRSGSLVVKRGVDVLEEGVDWSTNYTVPSGVIAILDGGGAPTSWSGQFDILARFDTDRLPLVIQNADVRRVFLSRNIPIVEERMASA